MNERFYLCYVDDAFDYPSEVVIKTATKDENEAILSEFSGLAKEVVELERICGETIPSNVFTGYEDITDVVQYCKKNVIKNRCCDRCGGYLLTSIVESYGFSCPFCDEDLYKIETKSAEINTQSKEFEKFCIDVANNENEMERISYMTETNKKTISVRFTNYQAFKKAFESLSVEKETFDEAVKIIVSEVSKIVRDGVDMGDLYKAGDDTMLYNYSTFVDDGYCGSYDSLSFSGAISHVFSENNEESINISLTFNAIF